jgi:PT repeat.
MYAACFECYNASSNLLGHNIGLLHDRGTSNACGASGYNYGYRDPAGSFRTILAYNCRTDECDNNSRSSCPRVQRFSTPNASFRDKPLGTSSDNSARWLNEKAVEVSNYYERKPLCGENQVWLQIDVTADDYPSETSWTLTNECSGEVLIDMKGATGDLILGTEEFNRRNGDPRSYICVHEQEFTFTINDSYGDGICCGHGQGGYQIQYEGMTQTLIIGGSFDYTETRTFKIGDCPTSGPSDEPSLKPSSAPTAAPSVSPTQIPTLLPTIIPSFRPSHEPSSSISPSYHPSTSLFPSAPPTKVASRTPSWVPTTSPSAHPTGGPSNVPSISLNPSASSKPSMIPSATPSLVPTDEPSAHPTNEPSTFPSDKPTVTCVDNTSFTFQLDNGNTQDCEWLTKNADKTDGRIASYCIRGHVKGGCQKSCDFCPCEDDASYRFILDNGTEQDCEWFVRNLDKIDVRRGRYCYAEDGVSASAVGDACVSSCGFCFVPPTRSPTAAPTQDPSMRPSREPSLEPSTYPLASPSLAPSSLPSSTAMPSPAPSTSQGPSHFPSISMFPSASPSMAPTQNPSGSPSLWPTNDPTATPTIIPSLLPTVYPTERPSVAPTGKPTLTPSDIPSNVPTASPTNMPSGTPSEVPSDTPTVAPTHEPSASPSQHPSALPSKPPSRLPSQDHRLQRIHLLDHPSIRA